MGMVSVSFPSSTITDIITNVQMEKILAVEDGVHLTLISKVSTAIVGDIALPNVLAITLIHVIKLFVTFQMKLVLMEFVNAVVLVLVKEVLLQAFVTQKIVNA